MKKTAHIFRYTENNDAYRRLDLRGVIFGGILFLIAGIFAYNFTRSVDPAFAVNFSNFKAGKLLSDYTMTNYTSMNESQIQAWLNKNAPCNNKNYASYQTLTKRYANSNKELYSWHWTGSSTNGHFVCISEELFGDGITIGKGETAARIIYKASQDYKINPQVLLTLLQKEQGLITDAIPRSGQYRAATGYACPDTAPCDPANAGFKNQVRKAASLFHTVMTGGWTNYPVGKNYIQYSPDKSCGGSTVNVQNLATSAFYRYTPYQPNAAALKAYPGTAKCGAYGNRNFYAYFQDWFGDPTNEIRPVSGKAKTAYEAVASTLGAQTGNLQENKKTGIKWYDFENGKLVGNDSKGWYVSYGGPRKVWERNGFESGVLGFPKSNIQENKETGMKWQEFEGGMAVGNATKGWYISYGGPRKAWEKLGFENGILGFPKSDIQQNKKTGMKWQEFEGGKLVGNATKGWYISYGKSRKVWERNGFESGVLGFPKSNIKKNEETGLEYQEYENGRVVGNDTKGWYISYGGPRKAWEKFGAEAGILGFPKSDIQQNKKTGMKWQDFEGGKLVGNATKGWYISYGGSRKVWEKLGFESGVLGFPKSNIQENKATGMKWQDYEGGKIVGNDEKGWFESRGSIRTKWGKAGYESGKYGFPTSNIINNSYQLYEGGKITK